MFALPEVIAAFSFETDRKLMGHYFYVIEACGSRTLESTEAQAGVSPKVNVFHISSQVLIQPK